jgi:hypothetical protein
MIKEKKNPNNSIVIDRLKCINDYDEENIEHHKVLKIIFSLCQKLLRLPGDEATKEFLQAFGRELG